MKCTSHHSGCDCYEAGIDKQLASLRDELFKERNNLYIAVDGLKQMASDDFEQRIGNCKYIGPVKFAKEVLEKIK